MKITITIDVPGGLPSARENRVVIRQSVMNVLTDQIQRNQETVAEPIVTAQDIPVAEVNCQAIYP